MVAVVTVAVDDTVMTHDVASTDRYSGQVILELATHPCELVVVVGLMVDWVNAGTVMGDG